MSVYVRLCEAMHIQGYVSLYVSLCEFARVYASLCEFMQVYSSLLEFTCVYSSLLQFTRVYLSLQKCSQIYTSWCEFTWAYVSFSDFPWYLWQNLCFRYLWHVVQTDRQTPRYTGGFSILNKLSLYQILRPIRTLFHTILLSQLSEYGMRFFPSILEVVKIDLKNHGARK